MADTVSVTQAAVEQAAIDLVVDLCGPGASQSETNLRVVEDHLKQLARRLAATQGTVPPAEMGYVAAFYEIAAMLGIGARADTPANVWASEMRPALKARRASTQPAPAFPREEVAEAIRQAKVEADKVYGVAWYNLEEISRVELILAALLQGKQP